ncbi:GNAT family N-acetyltransferase [Homoserinimonas sp. OAct 916]|uniref:GNAT family N-acetyltransferase n=1 Tax=Homoserinimonas sp. OAct 916 TaxID=2211450 RepID=UPI000DBE02E7|nr:GNAT family N-acetyltransferase [Homoserinimonas sp. OAct 916]
MTDLQVPGRVAQVADVDAVVETVTSAFFDDPLWAPIFSDKSTRFNKMAALWRVYVASAVPRFPWTFVTKNYEAATVWYPPGAAELTADEEAGFDEFLVELAGQAAAREVQAIGRAFDAARPTEPYYYLSLLATHTDHRGRGLGMALLRENLGRIDLLGFPTYLESSNPDNDRRYESVGYQKHGEITVPSGLQVSTFWRPAQS